MGNACQGSKAAVVETSHFAAADDRNDRNDNNDKKKNGDNYTPKSGRINDKSPPTNLAGKNNKEIEFSISGIRDTTQTEKERTLSTKKVSSSDLLPTANPPTNEESTSNALLPSSKTGNLSKDSKDAKTTATSNAAKHNSNEEEFATKSIELTELNDTTNSSRKDDNHNTDEHEADDEKKSTKTNTKQPQNDSSVVMESPAKATKELQEEADSDQVDVVVDGIDVPQIAVTDDEVNNIGINTADCEITASQSSEIENATNQQVMSSEEGIGKIEDHAEKDESSQSMLEVKNEAKEIIANTDSILLQNSNQETSVEPVKDQTTHVTTNVKGQHLEEKKEDSADIKTPKNQSHQTVVDEPNTINPSSDSNATMDENPPGGDISVVDKKPSQVFSSARNNVGSNRDKRSTQLRKIQKSQTMNVINYPNGDIYKGDTDDDKKPHGNGKMTYADGSNYQGAWVHGMRQGLGKVLFPDGSFYKGDFNANMFHGQGVMFWADGAYYSGEWVENQQHGQGKEVYPGGKKLRHEGLWQNGWPVRDEKSNQEAKGTESDDPSDLEQTTVARNTEQESSS